MKKAKYSTSLAISSVIIGAAVLSACSNSGQVPQEDEARTATSTPQAAAVPETLIASDIKDQMPAAFGLNTSRLFDAPLDDEDERFDRLEYNVQNIHDDVGTFGPALSRLDEKDKEIIERVEKLESRTAEPVAAAPTPFRAPKPVIPKATVSHSTFDGLRAVRIGDHAGKTRIVFDAAYKMTPQVSLDNTEKVLIADFSKGKSDEAVQKASFKSSLIKTLSQTTREEGFASAFSLSKETQIIDQGYLPPAAGNPNHRYFIDLKN